MDRGILVKLDKGVTLSSDVILSGHFMAAMAKFLRAISDFVDGRPPSRPATVLRGLYGLEAPPGRVADRLGITHGAISKLADRLIDKRLAVRLSHHPDGRTDLLMRKGEGEALVPRLAALADLHDAESLARFSDRAPRLIEKLMRRLVERRVWQSSKR